MKRWITFDLDGTLMQNPFGRWVFPEIEEAISACLGRPFEAAEELKAEHERRLRAGQHVAAYDWDDILSQLLARLGVEKRFDIESLVRKHAVVPKVCLLEPDTLPLLLEMKKRGYALAVVTNGFLKFQYPVMEVLGLHECFDEIVSPEQVGAGKPDEAVLRGLRQTGEIIAHVGDRLDHDVQLANRCGAISVLIERRLPAEVKQIPPFERVVHDVVAGLLQKKWVEESKQKEVLLPQEMVPRAIICCLEELFSII
jgi:putative hydrolase of the HAD superfamily